MDFKKLTLRDINLIKPYFNLLESRTCDLTVGGLFMWRDYYKTEYLIDDGVFISRLYDENGRIYYNLPISDNIEEAVKKVISEYKDKKDGIRFCTIPEIYLPYFEKICPLLKYEEQVENFDYVYRSEDLMELKGRKYSGQRNHISQFKRNVENWEFLDIKDVPTEKVKEFFTNFSAEAEYSTSMEYAENKIVAEVLDNLDSYDMLGGVLLANEKIIGFSFGEIIDNVLFTHIEKADRAFKGSYQMLTNQFSRMFGKNTEIINREDDTGDEGLRKAKQAYHPLELLKKYVVEVI